MTAERMLKGSVIVDMVKVVRGFKDLPWDQYLRPEDWKVVNAMVIPTAWYPVESYFRIGWAVYKLVAKENADTVRAFGKAAMNEMMQGPYKSFLYRNEPLEAVQKFLDLRKPLFNFSRMTAERTGGKSLRVTVFEMGKFETGLDIFGLLAGIQFQHIVEQNGGKNVKLETRVISTAKDDDLIFDLTWQ